MFDNNHIRVHALLPAIIDWKPERHWYAVHTRANFEQTVAGELATKGLENYLPAIEEIHHWKDRKKLVQVPLFRGYVFVRIADSETERLAVLRTSGAVRILGQGEGIEPVAAAEIQSIRLLLSARVRVQGHPFMREGDWVLVKRGALKGVEGILIRIKNQTRLVVSVSLLSQSVAAEVDASDVEVLHHQDSAGRRQREAAIRR